MTILPSVNQAFTCKQAIKNPAEAGFFNQEAEIT